MKKELLMAPGPVTVEPSALAAFGRPPIHHRTPEFESCLKKCRKLLQQIFDTDQAVLSFTSTGSGAMEAAVVNFLSPGDKVIVVVSGKFGERWAEMLEAYGMECICIHIEWGKSISPEHLEKELKKHDDLKAVYCQMCETSTGALHPIELLGPLIKKHHKKCLFCVDAITGALTREVDLKNSMIDVYVAGSQKAFMLPTGLSFITCSELALDQMGSAKCPRFYFDLRKEMAAYDKGQTYFSSPVNLYFSLEKSLEYIIKKGAKKHYREIEKRADSVRESMSALGINLVTENPAPALSAFAVPEGIDGKKFRLHLEEKYGLSLMGGQNQWAGKIIRIGHIGYINEEDLRSAVERISSSLEDFGFNVDKKKAMKAFEQCWGGSND